ncbi:MAG: sugar phosphate isomerase/epimerase [Pedobacter sp.]|nr:sugar phosphate isomerase/epimerase [Pedobacter sp.]
MNQTRRKFLQQTSMIAAASLLAPIAESHAKAFQHTKPGYQLLFMQTDWGFEGTRDQFCAAAKKEGYDGIEVWWPEKPADQQLLFDALKKHGLQVGFLCGAGETNPTEHLAHFKRNLDAICSNTSQRPVYVNCHSGKDYFTFEQNRAFIEYTTAKTKATGIKIHHETHRGRMLFAATVTKNFADQQAGLRLTLDISHWCTVHESLLADQQETINDLLKRVDHIHSRIGHPEGPQVNDPRAPEWGKAVNAHLAWWDQVIAYKKQKGETMTILTEFGPPDYMPTLPYTRQPLANQWAINVYMMNLLKKRYH